MTRPTKYSRGFTLMEMLVAFMLALVGVLALVSVFPGGLKAIQQSSDSLTAQAIAQYNLDYIREYYQTETGLPATFAASGATFDCSPQTANPNMPAMVFRGQTQTPTTFTCDYTYSNVGGVGLTPEHRIDFIITWTDQTGPESRTYEEYVIN